MVSVAGDIDPGTTTTALTASSPASLPPACTGAVPTAAVDIRPPPPEFSLFSSPPPTAGNTTGAAAPPSFLSSISLIHQLLSPPYNLQPHHIATLISNNPSLSNHLTAGSLFSLPPPSSLIDIKHLQPKTPPVSLLNSLRHRPYIQACSRPSHHRQRRTTRRRRRSSQTTHIRRHHRQLPLTYSLIH